jgi:mannose-6-phosphate isomerase-like protein (cupin superfamily)
MTNTTVRTPDPAAAPRSLASEPGGGKAWWFLGTLAVLRNPEGAPRTPTVIELTVPPGGSPPLHVHERLDDSFLLLEGEVLVRCGEQSLVARVGSYVALPAGVEHTFRVMGDTPARMLLIHADDEFLDFIEAVGAPAQAPVLPLADAGGNLDRGALTKAAAEHALRIVGPPLDAGAAQETGARSAHADGLRGRA